MKQYRGIMNKFFELHDYDNCIVNLANSVLNRFGVYPEGKTLACADTFLKKDYKNVVVLLLDGLGTYIMEENLKEEGVKTMKEYFRFRYSMMREIRIRLLPGLRIRLKAMVYILK